MNCEMMETKMGTEIPATPPNLVQRVAYDFMQVCQRASSSPEMIVEVRDFFRETDRQISDIQRIQEAFMQTLVAHQNGYITREEAVKATQMLSRQAQKFAAASGPGTHAPGQAK